MGTNENSLTFFGFGELFIFQVECFFEIILKAIHAGLMFCLQLRNLKTHVVKILNNNTKLKSFTLM